MEEWERVQWEADRKQLLFLRKQVLVHLTGHDWLRSLLTDWRQVIKPDEDLEDADVVTTMRLELISLLSQIELVIEYAKRK